MEQSLLQKLLCDVKGVMDKYDLSYSEDALTKILGAWWVQQVRLAHAFA